MEQSFADLLSDAFSETSGPSFPDGDMDFENLNFSEEKKVDTSEASQKTKEVDDLHQEAASAPQAEDVNMEENDGKCQLDEEDFLGVGVMGVDEPQEEDYTSSEGDSEREGSVSEDDEGNEEEEEDFSAGEEPEDLLMSVCCSGNKEDRICAEGQLLASEGAEYTEDRNKEQSDEEVSYFERVPEHEGETGIEGHGTEDDEQEREEAKQDDSSDSEREGMKIKQEEEEEHCFAQEIDNPYRQDHRRENWSLEFPEISVKNLQYLLAEVESEECVVKVEEFSGEEHQEAGESVADYPSDFSSCEYVEEKHQLHESSKAANQDGDGICMGRGEDIDKEEEEYLYSRNLEDVKYLKDLDGTSERKNRGMLELPEGEAEYDDEVVSESDSCSSSDYKDGVKRSDEDLSTYTDNLGLQDDKQHKESQLQSGHRADFSIRSISDDYHRGDAADLDINWNPYVSTTTTLQTDDLLTTEDTDKVETLLSGVIRPAEDHYSSIQKEHAKPTISSKHGSLDDSFFFNTRVESFCVTELSQQADDECEDERNWDQEKERIKAFYKFYDDSDKEEGGEERQTKVQFCADPLSRVIRYESESDRDSTSSSTDVEEDLSSAEISEELQEPVTINNKEKKPAIVVSNAQIQDVPDLRTTPVCTGKQKCLSVLKLSLKMVVVIVMGLLMFWSVTD